MDTAWDQHREHPKMVRSFAGMLLLVSGESTWLHEAEAAMCETAMQSEQLRELDCDRGQGYLFARPQPAELIEQLFTASIAVQQRAA